MKLISKLVSKLVSNDARSMSKHLKEGKFSSGKACWISFMVKKCAADQNWTYFLHLSTVLLILETAAQTTKLLAQGLASFGISFSIFSASARSTVAFIWLRAHMFGSAKQTTPIGHRILCANPRTMSKQHRWMRRFSYDLLSIPEFFKDDDDALTDHSYKSYNPQIGTSLKILKCVLMCRASGKWIQHDSTIPNMVLGHVRILVMVAGAKIWTPSFLLRISFGPWFTEVISGTWKVRHLPSFPIPPH